MKTNKRFFTLRVIQNNFNSLDFDSEPLYNLKININMLYRFAISF